MGPLAGDKWEPTPSMKKILLIAIVLAVILVGWIFLRNREDVVVVSPESTTNPPPIVSKNVVIYTDSGYTPSTITIKKGETVTWKNESSAPMWTASAMHPTHRVYPGTDIAACGTQTLLPMFDACKEIAPGQSWSFIFVNVGTWTYHNHLKSSQTGKIIVE